MASVSTTVQATSESQQLELSIVAIPNAAQSVETTESEPCLSERSLREQKLEEDGNAIVTSGDFASTEEERMFGISNVFANVKEQAKKVGPGISSVLSAGAEHVAQVWKVVPAVSSAVRAQAERVVVALDSAKTSVVKQLHVPFGVHALKKADSEDANKAVERLEKLVWGPSVVKELDGDFALVKELDDVPENTMVRLDTIEESLKKYRSLRESFPKHLDDSLTAKKVRGFIFAADATDANSGADPDVFYSMVYRDWLLKDLGLVDASRKEMTDKGHELLEQLLKNPVALKLFGPLMDETRQLDEIYSALSRPKIGFSQMEEDAAELLVKIHTYVKLLDKKTAKKKQAEIDQWVKNHYKIVVEGWKLPEMKNHLRITDETRRDSLAFEMLVGLKVARMKNDLFKEGTPEVVQNKAFHVVDDLEKDKLAQKYLPEAVGSDKSEQQIVHLLDEGNIELGEVQHTDVMEASKLLMRVRELVKHMSI
uniref:Uncharacterized protein n=1 Tax=Peronospora matthiolae TaxID=2874970 RepID=A0AAV1T8W5_9STRA